MRIWQIRTSARDGDHREFLLSIDGQPVRHARASGMDIADLLRRTGQRYHRESTELRSIGSDLFDMLDGTSGLLAGSIPQSGKLRLEVEEDCELSSLPLETLAPLGDPLVSRDELDFSVVRTIDVRRGASARTSGGRDWVYFVSDPVDVEPRLRFESERDGFLQSLWMKWVPELVESGDPGELEALLSSKTWFGLHVTAHGAEGADGFAFVTRAAGGRGALLPLERFCGHLAGRLPPVVFLSLCMSGAGHANTATSLCKEFIHAGAQVCIGWHGEVSDLSAGEFAHAFYDAIAHGSTVEGAFAVARAALIARSKADWHLPRLFAARDCAAAALEYRMAGAVPVSATPARPPFAFIGRQSALQRARRALSNPSGRPVVAVVGPEGIGKTTLVRAIQQRMPGTTFAEVAEADAVILRRRLIPEGKVSLSQIPNALSGDFPIYVVEDVQGGMSTLPESFLAMLGAGSPGRVGTRLLVTSQSPESWVDDDRVEMITLSGMRGPEWDKLLAQLPQLTMASRMDFQLSVAIMKLTGGNPRLLRWAEHMLSQGAPPTLDTLATICSGVAHKQAETWARLLEREGEDVRGVVEAVSVLESPTPKGVLRAMCGPIDLARGVGRAEALGLIDRWYSPLWIDEVFGLAQHVFFSLERSGRVGDQKERAGRGLDELLRGDADGNVELNGGQLVTVLELSLKAGRNDMVVRSADLLSTAYMQSGRHGLAESMCRSALERVEDLRLRHTLGNALQNQGRREEAIAEYRKALELPQVGQPELKDELASMLLNFGNALAGAGRWHEARQAYERARAMSDTALATSACDVRLGALACHEQDEATARDRFESALRATESEGRWLYLPQMLSVMAQGFMELRRYDEVLPLLRRYIRLAREHGQSSALGEPLLILSEALLYSGSLGEAMTTADMAKEIGENKNDFSLIGGAHMVQGLANSVRDRRAEAKQSFLAARSAFASAGLEASELLVEANLLSLEPGGEGWRDRLLASLRRLAALGVWKYAVRCLLVLATESEPDRRRASLLGLGIAGFWHPRRIMPGDLQWLARLAVRDLGPKSRPAMLIASHAFVEARARASIGEWWRNIAAFARETLALCVDEPELSKLERMDDSELARAIGCTSSLDEAVLALVTEQLNELGWIVQPIPSTKEARDA